MAQKQTSAGKKAPNQSPKVAPNEWMRPALSERVFKTEFGRDAEIVGVTKAQLPLTRVNFIVMAVAALLIVVGFLLMIGGSTTTEAFNPDIFSPRRIIVAPTIAFIGFLVMGFGIVYRPRKRAEEEPANVESEKQP